MLTWKTTSLPTTGTHINNALKQLDERSVAALQTMASALLEAANVGILPCKWGGVFGQELFQLQENREFARARQLEANVEEWKTSYKDDILQDVRKAKYTLSAEHKDRITTLGSGNLEVKKLPVTVLSGFLGSGKVGTFLAARILSFS